jgi:hypothetical protein
MIGSMNDYRPLTRPFRLAMPYLSDRSDWRTSAMAFIAGAIRRLFQLRGVQRRRSMTSSRTIPATRTKARSHSAM